MKNIPQPSLSQLVRFWTKVQEGLLQPHAPSRCWEWTAEKLPANGGTTRYGIFRIAHEAYVAHRVSYAWFRGELDASLSVLHRCDNRSCVRPDHLFLGTQKDNVQDMMSKRRNKPKPRSLSHATVTLLREKYKFGWTMKELAQEHSIPFSTVHAAIRGRFSYSEVPGAISADELSHKR